MTLEELKRKICVTAAAHGWHHLRTQEWCINFFKNFDQDKAVMNVYWNKKTDMQIRTGFEPNLVIQSAINHPKKGKTQLHRRGVNLKLLEKLFENPRQHTGKGYYEK